MIKKYFCFNGKQLFEMSKRSGRRSSLNAVSAAAGVSYPTCLAYTNDDISKPQNEVLERLYVLITDGMGFTEDELMGMQLVDVFQIVHKTDGQAKVISSTDFDSLREKLIREAIEA